MGGWIRRWGDGGGGGVIKGGGVVIEYSLPSDGLHQFVCQLPPTD